MIKESMKVKRVAIRNFRRLEHIKIDIEKDQTVFVGPNNSGKTSATAIFRCFIGGKDFKIHDFPVSKTEKIDSFEDESDEDDFPTIELDLWFSLDPSNIAFGRAFILLPELSDNLQEVGVRLKYAIRDSKRMLADYSASYPKDKDGQRNRSLSQFLGMDQNLNKYFEIRYYSLDSEDKETQLEYSAGKALLKNLIRIDFVDAQRNINDDEGSRSTRLSSAFATFYKKNLEQAEIAKDAHSVIDQNNEKLTRHYKTHFQDLMKVIKGLGVPSINDRELKLVSSLSPEMALQGNTDLVYIDPIRNHELPEAYNGLGYKNLIYMAIQVSHFHLQWLRTEKNRPLCQLIFIEEPEVHLHAQVQQTFITNMWQVISDTSKDSNGEALAPQFLVTTHSSHVLDAVEFSKVRHFQRRELDGEERNSVITLNASVVNNLRKFQPESIESEEKSVSPKEALDFLKRYLMLTHCDLFFADAAILIEGTVEKLLLPKMIKKTAPDLQNKYLSILEVGGAYAHRFYGLLQFLRIPYLIITDLDSVEAGGRHPACRGDLDGALTSNASLKEYFDVSTVKELTELRGKEKVQAEQDRCISFQTKIRIADEGALYDVIPRTLEEAFIFENIKLIRSRKWKIFKYISRGKDAYQEIYEMVQSSSFKKTEFALDVLSLSEDWCTPSYIAEGLKWLNQRLTNNS